MRYVEFLIFTVVLTTFIVLLSHNISMASPVNAGEGNKIYNQLAEEYEIDKSSLDRGEPVDKLGLMFKGYALDAVDFTKQNFKKQLDFSGESIKDVEECLDILNKTREQHKPSDEQMLMTAKMYAGYIGQVIKLQWGGEWHSENRYPLNNGPAFQVKGQQLFLLSKVHRRLTAGGEDNIWHFYQVVEKDLGSR